MREFEDGEWTPEKRSALSQSTPIQETVTIKAQVHRSQSPQRMNGESRKNDYGRKISIERKPGDRKGASPSDAKRPSAKTNIQNNFTNVLSELKKRKSSVDSNLSNSSFGKGVPPPPPMPPPLESHDPSESRPFIDPYGRAKTVRIGKWRQVLIRLFW